MKTLIYGSGPIGRWLAVKMFVAGQDVTLLARNKTFQRLEQMGVEMIDWPTGERLGGRINLVERLEPDDRYDLIIVVMSKPARLAVCPILGRNKHLGHVLFVGNDISGYPAYFEHVPKEKVLLGFPSAGGGYDGDDLVIADRKKPKGRGKIFFGEIDGQIRDRTRQIAELFENSGIQASIERDIDGWLKYHFAFVGPTAGIVFKVGGFDAVASDKEAIHLYCKACREAGDILYKLGYKKRQPPIFNLYYWLPRWLEPKVFAKLFGSELSKVMFGLHADSQTIPAELAELSDEFALLKSKVDMQTPSLDELMASIPRPSPENEGAAA